MFFRPKTEVIAWNDFFGEMESTLTPKQKRTLNALLASATAAYALRADQVFAMGIQDRIIHAFQPITDMVQGVAYPITFIMLVGGFLLVIIDKRSKGITMIKWAAIGYIGIQFAPSIMQILVEVGKAIKAP